MEQQRWGHVALREASEMTCASGRLDEGAPDPQVHVFQAPGGCHPHPAGSMALQLEERREATA